MNIQTENQDPPTICHQPFSHDPLSASPTSARFERDCQILSPGLPRVSFGQCKAQVSAQGDKCTKGGESTLGECNLQCGAWLSKEVELVPQPGDSSGHS